MTSNSIRMNNNHEEFRKILHDNPKTMTVKQESQKFHQYFYAIIGCIGALVIGTTQAWTSPSTKFLSSDNYSAPFMLRDRSESDLIAALTPLGAIFGALTGGILADSFGRKLILTVSTVPWIGTWILTTYAPNVRLLYLARFISGIVVGLFSTILPMYVNEIAEDSIKGSLGILFQLFVTVGILLVYVLGVTNSYTILCLSITAVCFVLLVGLFFIPESPVYSMKRKRRFQAEKSLIRLRGPYYDVSIELNELNERMECDAKRKFSMVTLCNRENIVGLVISAGLMIFQQFSGINAVIFFAESIFENAGASSPELSTICVGAMQTIATVVSGMLVERVGRKILLLFSSISMCACLAALGYYFWMLDQNYDVSELSWLPLVSLVGLIVAYALGLGPLPWMMSGEVLAPGLKSVGATITATANLICLTLVTLFFQPLMNLITRACTFWLFASVCALAAIFTLLVLPETKGRTIQEVQAILAGRKMRNSNGYV